MNALRSALPVVLVGVASTLACSGPDAGESAWGQTSQAVDVLPNGDYLLLAADGSCAATKDASLDNGADVLTTACSGAAEQQWRFIQKLANPPGSFRVRNVNSNKCLRARGDSDVVQGACAYQRSKWLVNQSGAYQIQLESAKTPACATAQAGTVTQTTCSSDATQVFQAVPVVACSSNADCDDGNACTDDACGPNDVCVPVANGGVGCPCVSNGDCNDRDACTDDACNDGVCEAQPNGGAGCPCSTNADCDDGDGCTDDACVGGSCSQTPNGGTGCACAQNSDCVAEPGGKRAECLWFNDTCVTIFCDCHCVCDAGWTSDTMCLSTPCDSCLTACTEACAPGGGTYSGDCS